MGAILIAAVVVVVIAIGAGAYLRPEREPAWQAYSTSSTRVGDPGSNLVGPNWTGEAVPGEAETET